MNGRSWAYTGAILGGAVSIAANVAHSFIPPKEEANPAAWSPEVGAVVGSVVWPIFLFVAVEILARVAWPDGRIWHLLRWGGLLPVAAVAALVSYRHGSGLLAHYGEEPIVCVLGPLAIDGLMVMATGALLATGNHRHTPDHQPVPANPDATSVPAPTTTSTEPNKPPVPVDVPPPAVDRNPVNPAPALPETAAPARSPEPDSTTAVPTPDVVAARIATPTTISQDRSTATSRPAAPPARPRPRNGNTVTAPLPRPAADTPVTEPDAVQLQLPTLAPALLELAEQAARQYRTEHGSLITPGQLAARLRISSELAAEALTYLRQAPHHPTQPRNAVNGSRPSKATR